jgi:DNA-binding PadR family transcriptional regulator
MIEVEEIALGPVLRRLNEMAGIAKLHLDMGRGGEQGQAKIADAAETFRGTKRSSVFEADILKFLRDGHKHISEISALIGGKRTRAYGLVHALRKKGLVEGGPDSGSHQLTAKGRALLSGGAGATPALAAPAAAAPAAAAPVIRRGPKGVALKGENTRLVCRLLSEGPIETIAMRRKLEALGYGAKSIDGLTSRARISGYIRTNKDGAYELTPKGTKLNQLLQGTPAQANGSIEGAATHAAHGASQHG